MSAAAKQSLISSYVLEILMGKVWAIIVVVEILVEEMRDYK